MFSCEEYITLAGHAFIFFSMNLSHKQMVCMGVLQSGQSHGKIIFYGVMQGRVTQELAEFLKGQAVKGKKKKEKKKQFLLQSRAGKGKQELKTAFKV